MQSDQPDTCNWRSWQVNIFGCCKKSSPILKNRLVNYTSPLSTSVARRIFRAWMILGAWIAFFIYWLIVRFNPALMFLLGLFATGMYILTRNNESAVPSTEFQPYHLNIHPSKSQSPFSNSVPNEPNISYSRNINSQLEKQLSKQASLIQDLEVKILQRIDSGEKMKRMESKIDVLSGSIGSIENRNSDRLDGQTIVQNITYNINDSAIAGDINNNLQLDTKEK